MRRALEDLARFHGVEVEHWDGLHRHVVASDDALVAALRALGVDLAGAGDADDALRRVGLAAWDRGVEASSVTWRGDAPSLRLRFREADAGRRVRVTLAPEGDAAPARVVESVLGELARTDAADVEGVRFLEATLPLGAPLDDGRHVATVEGLAAGPLRQHVLAAPRAAFTPDEAERGWGVFVPLYALHSARSLGVGDLTDLEALVDWVRRLGGDVVGTLPLLATFLGDGGPFDPSPYAPVSRLFWNEVYLDVDRLPELAASADARAARAAPEVAGAVGGAADHVDWATAMRLKRRVLAPCARAFFAAGGASDPAFRAFLADHPRSSDYARFRAATEAYGAAWHVWPDAARAGDLTAVEVDADTVRLHLYAQFRAAEQAGRVAGGLYLDLPLGVHPDGYDAYRMRDVFLEGVSAGAPPDELFTQGQDWGFRPLHPERGRASGWDYFAECLRHPMAASRILRIDHVMGLHRIYCVPLGMSAQEGVYVHYPADELWANVTLESVRHRTRVMGEDLGTVPDAVRERMATHRLLRTYVLQFALDLERDPPLLEVPAESVASVNTHDVPTFGAFLAGTDLAIWRDLGLMTDDEVAGETGRRAALRRGLEAWAAGDGGSGDPDVAVVLDALLEAMGRSDARYVMVNLEDLWGETAPQNVPGTSGDQQANWSRRAALDLDRIVADPRLAARLRRLARARRRE